MAPEVLTIQPDYDFKCDIWSMGVVLYEMITKKLPFPAMVNLIINYEMRRRYKIIAYI